jgi:hypothetical protein
VAAVDREDRDLPTWLAARISSVIVAWGRSLLCAKLEVRPTLPPFGLKVRLPKGQAPPWQITVTLPPEEMPEIDRDWAVENLALNAQVKLIGDRMTA